MSTHRFAEVGVVLFDLDGTLIDSAPDLGAAADRMRVQRGMPSLPLEVYRPHASSGARGMLAIAFGIGPDAPDYQALREEFLERAVGHGRGLRRLPMAGWQV